MTGSSIPDGYEPPATDEALLAECRVDVFRATGPGGQGVNTTDSAVRLTHLPTGVVVVCRRQRSQTRNKAECLDRLRQRIAALMAPPPPPRKRSRPTRGAVEKRLSEKAARSATKSTRRKPSADE